MLAVSYQPDNNRPAKRNKTSPPARARASDEKVEDKDVDEDQTRHEVDESQLLLFLSQLSKAADEQLQRSTQLRQEAAAEREKLQVLVRAQSEAQQKPDESFTITFW